MRHSSPSSSPSRDVVGVDLEGLLGEQVVDARGAAGLGAGVVGLEAAAGGEPDGIVVVDDLGRVAVADDLEDAAAVLELVLVEDRGAGVVLVGDRPLVLALVDAVPVETVVDRRELQSSLKTSLAES